MLTPSIPSEIAICARELRKSFGDTLVLDGLNLTVPAGAVVALLGPNGSGKTTTVRILTTLIPADGGTGSVAGHDIAEDVAAVRRSIGVTGQFAAVDKQFTGRGNLRLMADLAHLPKARARQRVEELLAEFDLLDAADRPAETYSGGMLRRLDVAMTLIRTPQVLFLDEPTTGLNPRSCRGVWEEIRALVADGVTVLLTTQYLEEADQLADRIAVLDNGKIVAEGRSADQGPRPRRPEPHSRRRLPRPHRPRHHPRVHRRRPPGAPMTTIATDSRIMFRRSLTRMKRYPSLTLIVALYPIVFLLLFVYVFGDTNGRGIGGRPTRQPGVRHTSAMSCRGFSSSPSRWSPKGRPSSRPRT